MKLCVAYCRVSTDSNDQKNSIEAQRQYYTSLFMKKEYNVANVGMIYKKDGTKEKLIGIFADEGISGTSLNRREAFKTMIEYAKKRTFDIIYVKSVSRFARSVEDGVKILKDLKEVGVGVYFEDCGINSLDYSKEFEITLRMMLAQEESRTKSDNVKWGMLRLYEKGGWNGAPPYGYIVDNGFLKVELNEAEIVRKVYDLFLNEGYGTGKTARYLNDNNIPTKKGTKWSQTQVSTILENVIYTGLQINHITETIDINRKMRADVEATKHIKHKFEYLRIISDDIYNMVQMERKKRHDLYSNHKGHSNKNLLSCLLYCGECGGVYKRKKRHSYKRKDGTQLDIGYEWTCQINDMYGKSRCSHRVALIEDEAIEQIKREIVDLKTRNMDDLFELYLKTKFNYDISEDNYNVLLKQKKRTLKEIEILRGDFADEIIGKDEYKEQMKELNNKYVGIAAEIERIKRYDIEIESARLKYKQFINNVKSIDVNNLTNAGLKKIFKNIIVKGCQTKNGQKVKIMSFNYYCLDMSIDEIVNKAAKLGYKVKGVTIH